MGVSLERVQNKFACIIGELCNEPLVLSQFAVWLDMRLAEYKAKGSLCLECSGDIPTPIWLKGLPLKEPIVEAEDRWELPRDTGQSFRGDELGRRGDNLHEPNKYNRRHRSFLPHGDSGTATPISHPSSPIRTDLHLHSNIAIKQEVLDQDIAPLGLHSSDNYHTDSRKRTAEFENLYSSPSKVQRFSSEKDNAEVSPYTEPLSSIIDPQDTPISKSEGLVPVENMSTSSQQAYENVIDDDDDIQVEILGGPSSLIHSPATSINQTYPGPSTSETGHSLAANSADSESSRLSFGDSMSADPANLTDIRAYNPHSSSGNWNVPHPQATSANLLTQRKTASSVGLFQRWLTINMKENRPIRTIPPEQLDHFLATFLSNCKKMDGGEYSAKSLKGLRESIERHLKDAGYSDSIISSPKFRNSQKAYRIRFKQLMVSGTYNTH